MNERNYFNSRPHEEVDTVTGLNMLTRDYFNSRPHEEVDGSAIATTSAVDISTHDLTKRSTVLSSNSVNESRYFNSRPHEEVDTRL